jgi:hypothetical protein
MDLNNPIYDTGPRAFETIALHFFCGFCVTFAVALITFATLTNLSGLREHFPCHRNTPPAELSLQPLPLGTERPNLPARDTI